MTTHPVVIGATQHVPDPVLWRFVARVQALSPADWGRLDAYAAPLHGQSPAAISRRLRLMVASFGEPLREGLGELAPDVLRAAADDPWGALKFLLGLLRPSVWKGIRNAQRPELPPDLPPETRAEIAAIYAQAEDHERAWHAIEAAARAQPLGMGAAVWSIMFASFAVSSRDDLSPALVARLYAFVEPVIPYASLMRA